MKEPVREDLRVTEGDGVRAEANVFLAGPIRRFPGVGYLCRGGGVMSVADRNLVCPEQRPTGEAIAPNIAERIGLVPSRYFTRKRYVDRALAALLLIPGLPLMGLLVLLVRLTSPGPGLFRQVRVGQGGRLFTMYKIRTMGLDAENGRGAVWACRTDRRVTPVGRILRKLHLDEIPQLLNVLFGHMSLIGPRPERPEFVQVLASQIEGYCDRLAVLPGVTGLAQINLPPDADLDSVRRKLVLDLEYITRAGLLLDVRVLCCTLTRIAGIPGAPAARVFGLHHHVASEVTCEPPAGRDPRGGETATVRIPVENPNPDTIVRPHSQQGKGLSPRSTPTHKPKPRPLPR